MSTSLPTYQKNAQIQNQKYPEIVAMVIVRRPLKESLEPLKLLSPVTATEPLNLSLSLKARPALTDLTIKFCRCMPVA